MIVYVFAAIFVLLSIPLFLGKGSWLIAGYNTASEEEKKKYDEKKLCRTMGLFLLFIGGILFVTELVNTTWFAIISGIVICVIIVVFLIYANFGCKKK